MRYLIDGIETKRAARTERGKDPLHQAPMSFLLPLLAALFVKVSLERENMVLCRSAQLDEL